MRSRIIPLLLLSILLISPSLAFFADHEHGTNCTHDHQDFPEHEFIDVDEDFRVLEDDEEPSAGRNLASAANMRMYGYYGGLSSSPAGFRNYMQNILGPALISYFQGALKVKSPLTSKLRLSNTVCGISTSTALRNGVSADYVVMFQSTYDGTSNWVAESYACSLSTATKRPLVGKTNLNRALFKDPGSNILLHEKNIYLMLHEMTHSLGFSSSLYKYYLTPTGKVRSGHILTKSTALGNAKVLNVEQLTSRIRNFFGCSTIAGAYMENTGSDATAGSHFERRMFPFEAMTSGLIYQQSYSEFTLALLEGTGWYIPNYSYADPYWFGEGQGCNFLTQKCSSANLNFAELCTGTARGCTVVGRGGGRCASDTRSDGCRFVHPNVNYDCENPNAGSYARLASIQTFGRTAGSKCFAGTLSTLSNAASSSFCFKYTCSGSGSTTKLVVNVGKTSVNCTKKAKVTVSGYKGTLNCPDPLEFCSTVGKPACPRGCMGRGTCQSGKCICYKGFKGKDCGLNI